MIMQNFNHERWYIATVLCGWSLGCYEDDVKWLLARRAFGKTLMKQPHLRQKMAKIVYQIESLKAYLDAITYQMCTMSFKDQNTKLAGPICLLKTMCARTFQEIADESVQIFGGRGLTKTGMGQNVCRLRACGQYEGILGGTNEVLLDYAMRQIARAVPKW